MDIRLAVIEIGGYKCLWEEEGNSKSPVQIYNVFGHNVAH